MLNKVKSRFLSGIKLTFLGIALLFTYHTLSQNRIIQIMENQTTHLIFPSDIIYTDIGDNGNYITSYTNNILRIKGVKTLKQTNLTILTKDQHYYSFFVGYLENPQLNYFITTTMATKVLGKTNNKSPPALSFSTNRLTKKEVKQVNLPVRKQSGTPNINDNLFDKAASLLNKPHLYDYIGARHGDIQLKVTGIYHSLSNCFMVYEIRNRGAIPYDVSYVEFGIKERRASQKVCITRKKAFSPFYC